ncbi:ABC transporter [Oceanococcus atlanticus]|uniref:ABC transporter n=2 Tax=Oceanococcus atlanticus TaxID=1317117 RepID=A0A1Y1SJQ4_9GAMM|nr:ABC transporter [Oceanococcus atlanticus]
MALLIGAKLASVALPYVLKLIVDSLDLSKAPPGTAVAVPLALLLGYGALRFASVAFGELRDLVFGRVTENAMRRIALSVFTHLHRLDLDFHLTRRTGGLSRDIERGVSGVRFLLRFLLFNIIPTLLEIALVAAILLSQFGWQYGLIIVFAVIIYIAWSVIITEWRTSHVRSMNRLDSHANTRAVDSLLNYETVKYFGNEDFEASEYDNNLRKWENAMVQGRLSLATLNAGQAVIIATAVTAMLVLAAQGVAREEMTLGDLVMINAYMIQLFVPLNFLGFVYREIKQALANMARMFALLDEPARIVDKPQAQDLPAGPATVLFDNIHFAYRDGREVLHGVELSIPAGHTVAVVGSSGAGKSTLARLLFRFYDPTHGAIRINGEPLSAYRQQSLRANIGVVPQDTVLFNDTIAYNIAYGKPGASAEEIQQAAKLAHLAGFIEQLPDGLNTQVGERGLKLSGGEKQRIAIARTILKNPGMLIFDEATASLDSVSERAILNALKDVAQSRTTLVIAHRLSTVIDADEIVVLEDGRIVERGRHSALLALGGRYAELWNLQKPAD